MSSTYWRKGLAAVLGRRRVLALTGSAAAGAALSLACGSKSGGKSSAARTNMYVPVDTTKQAKAGGTYRDSQTQDFEHFDSLISSSGGPDTIGARCYSRLLQTKPG